MVIPEGREYRERVARRAAIVKSVLALGFAASLISMLVASVFARYRIRWH